MLTTVGYSLLPLFCKRGTISPANPGEKSMALNAGPVQLPVYQEGPDAGQPLTLDAMKVSFTYMIL